MLHALLLATVVLLAACGGGATTSSATTPTPGAPVAAVEPATGSPTTTTFTADITLTATADGGRATAIFDGHRPQVQIAGAAVAGTIELPDGTERLDPGFAARVTITTTTPVTVDAGTTFELRDGVRVIGSGTVVSAGS
jgi:translation elongation factor EF-Tu-like GTPase